MKTILITGSNRGIGLELVRQYAQEADTHIFAACRTPENAGKLATLANAYQGQIQILPLDVSRVESIQAMAEQLATLTPQLDILINNAAVNPKEGRHLGQINMDAYLDVLRVNVVSPVMVVQALRGLLGRGSKIINISSQRGSLAGRQDGGDYVYPTSKAALNMNTRALANDLGPEGIITISLDPGWVKTDMGGLGARLTPEQSIHGIRQVIGALTDKDNGAYLAWDGTTHPW